MSPLHSVIENGQSDCIEILLDYGADLNSANEVIFQFLFDCLIYSFINLFN